MKYQHLVGLPYIASDQDCYGILRRFYADNFGIHLSDYARPDQWWNRGMSLYSDHAYQEGFRLIDLPPMDWQYGDVFGIQIDAPTVHHVCIYVGENKILHHYTDRISECVPYRHIWRKHTVCMWRHKDLMNVRMPEETIQFGDIMHPNVKQELGL